MAVLHGQVVNIFASPPTFGPIFCIVSKFIQMSAHAGVSFAWLVKYTRGV